MGSEIARKVRFVRVTFAKAAKRSSVFLDVISEGDRFLSGARVNRSGDKITKPGVDVIMEIIEKEAIASVREYEESKLYGFLIPRAKQIKKVEPK